MNKLNTRQIINIVLIILLLVFTEQNLDGARVDFLMFAFELPLVILIALVFFAGFIQRKSSVKMTLTEMRTQTSMQ
jgi:uncharacterized integral membrane protein